jgi:hypothetical protein
MVFNHVNEPVLLVLDKIRNNEITWAGYQDELSRKGGQGICLKSGVGYNIDVKYANFCTPSNILSSCAVIYSTGFISFSLYVRATTFNTNTNNGLIKSVHRIEGQYNWAGVCRGGGTSSFDVYIGNGNYNYYLYQGGSALGVAQLRARGSSNCGTTDYASIYY